MSFTPPNSEPSLNNPWNSSSSPFVRRSRRRLLLSNSEPPNSSSSPFVRRSRRRLLLSNSENRSGPPPLPSYFDSGDPIYICQKCNAYYWFGERVLRDSPVNNLVYNQCCKSDDVVLPPLVDPPLDLVQLFSTSEFMDNIRAYNMMFSMTYFEAKVDFLSVYNYNKYRFSYLNILKIIKR